MGANQDIPNNKKKKINQKQASFLESKQTKNCLENIKSKYILEQILIYLKENKKLNIIKYNKNIQTRLDIDIKTYKYYSENYSPIKIEIIPIKNKYDKFINAENLNHIHIYFNGSKIEIKKTVLTKNDKIKKIEIIIDYQVKSFERLFFSM